MTIDRHRPPSAPPGAPLKNQREGAIVDWLIGRIGDRLGDRSGQRHAPPWEPKQNVVLGVLEPIRITPAPAAPTASPVAPTPAAPAGPLSTAPTGEIPSIALDFRMRETSPGAGLALNLDVAFALYMEEVATLAEQRTYLGAAETAELVAPAHDSPADGVQDDHATTGTEGTEGGTNEVVAPTAAATATPAVTLGSRVVRKRAKKTRLLGAWRRHEITLPTMHVDISADGAVTTIAAPLVEAAKAVIDAHYAGASAMRPFVGSARNELPREVLDDEAVFAAAVDRALDRAWAPRYPDLEVTAFAQPLGDGEYLVSVALRNATELTERTLQDLAVYDTQIAVHPGATTEFVRQRFDLAPDDYRMEDLAEVPGRGTACVAVATDAGGIRAETLPTHVQRVVDPRVGHVDPLQWSALSAAPELILDSVQAAMEDYAAEYAQFVAAAGGTSHHREAQAGLDQFTDELRRFKLGLRAMRDDPRLAQAFQLANEVFAQANSGARFDTWRLFQLVYIVSHLPALAARENDDVEMRRELDHADVLWFPAGGGKTEAYLGLIITAMFYDRDRGKDGGVTSWLRFPLRMLSVQQLFRMLRVLVIAEDLRRENNIGRAGADPFSLGYLVGGGGTPNSLKYPKAWWRGWEAEVRAVANGTFTEDHAKDRLVTRCPYCSAASIDLVLDVDAVRLIHQCTTCGRSLPLHMTDVEVYRHLPTVVISTVDKLSGYTWFPEYTAFSRGARFRCPKHGYFSFPTGGACLAGADLCDPPKSGYPAAPYFKDPVPALTIQDEMHLLKEELGAFSGHYEGLIAELQRGGPSALPTKILTASATIEQYQDQLRQVYGRIPRAFPSPGYDRDRSFYTQTQPTVRRTFLGILPHYRRKADVAAAVQGELLRAITELQDDPAALAALGLEDPTSWADETARTQPPQHADAVELLFNYEVSLGYVNSKAHGSKLEEELRSLSSDMEHDGLGAVQHVVLTGQVPIPDLAEAISRVQNETLATDRAERLRAMVGTSVVSHGVDLDRLNVLIMAGMPTTAADYIQVTARSGRTHAGLVVTVYDAFSRRERSLFTNFASYHQFLDQMVTPVPVNKYAYFVASRTVPGLALALLHDLARDPAMNAPGAGVRRAKDFQDWWRSHRAAVDTVLRERLRRCYETPIGGVNDPTMERELADRALERWADIEYPALSVPAQHKLTSELFHQAPLSNFRDIDEPADFPVTHHSRDAFAALTGHSWVSDQATDAADKE
ncbi:helicase-related protein [Cellulomonas fengjieae]|uniref:Helicase C-terminal domain-containing protein n=1 Tax=Cellulomonas fengjieae TaxID=2819978 RepID=A0ABS3SEC1_9CELL|nr:helicase-related protein [Cellulomonas fengjieae]MBO3084099.1 hypothetical protein [Cellulomonas fengjieae]QVI64646.1 hypothetical protein KG102_10660 [Cellulomonas fengjieae]